MDNTGRVTCWMALLVKYLLYKALETETPMFLFVSFRNAELLHAVFFPVFSRYLQSTTHSLLFCVCCSLHLNITFILFGQS